jgi:uncharacterized protein YkwD
MRKLFNYILLFCIIGCSQQENFYEPVDWDSEEEPTVLQQKSEKTSDNPKFVEELFRLHNQQRELKGRPAFILDAGLCEYAQKHSEWMAKHNSMTHSNIQNLIGKYRTAGENIAWNQPDEKTVLIDWMNSPGHRENIMNRSFNKVGFGLAYNKNNEPYWTTCFGD